jgi:membrane protease YdiL (CAAX protease family)
VLVTERRRALLALALVAPAPTIGVAAAMILWPGPIGRTVFTIAKLWLLLVPIGWHLVVETGRLGWSPPRRGGLGVGVLVGLASALVVLAAWYGLGRGAIDPGRLRAVAVEMGLGSPGRYALGAAYWILVNSVLEEYVFRWFLQRQCEKLVPRTAAAGLAAAIFTLHHVVALASYLDPVLTAVASSGVFGAGLAWSLLYGRYRSIWPPWVAHALADVAIFVCGWSVLF